MQRRRGGRVADVVPVYRDEVLPRAAILTPNQVLSASRGRRGAGADGGKRGPTDGAGSLRACREAHVRVRAAARARALGAAALMLAAVTAAQRHPYSATPVCSDIRMQRHPYAAALGATPPPTGACLSRGKDRLEAHVSRATDS